MYNYKCTGLGENLTALMPEPASKRAFQSSSQIKSFLPAVCQCVVISWFMSAKEHNRGLTAPQKTQAVVHKDDISSTNVTENLTQENKVILGSKESLRKKEYKSFALQTAISFAK